jgi:hypothetical protein
MDGKLRAAWLAAVGIGVAACVSCTTADARGGGAQELAGVDPALAFDLPSPSRVVSDGGEFPGWRSGADYASDLPFGACAAAGDLAQFSPDWSGGLAGAAYAIFRLGNGPEVLHPTLYINWQGQAPAYATTWLGFSDWEGDSWSWHNAPTAGYYTMADPADYADAEGRSLVALVLLGPGEASLESIGYDFTPNVSGYPVVDTGQDTCHDVNGALIDPVPGAAYYGQDAQYDGNQPGYTDNGDGTVTDNVTGLMWAQTPNNMEKVTFSEAFTVAENLTLGGYDDWRVPTIKELYSLIDFRGVTGMSALDATPYIDTEYFDFEYGDEAQGERHIDAQYWSSTEYIGTTMFGSATTFGVNFADGRIKGYGREHPQGGELTQFIRCVRGNPEYGVNSYVDNGDGTITDEATGLMWMQLDSGDLNAGPAGGGGMNWEQALEWAENLEYGGHDDWRLPNAKELQSIVDYSHAPLVDGLPAIDPLFSCTPIKDEDGNDEYAFYWTSTSHFDGPPDLLGNYACYVAFGTGLGFMEQPPLSGNYVLTDVHGAGCQRSDPKAGNPADYPNGHGPQGDVVRIYNMVRCVRGGLTE